MLENPDKTQRREARALLRPSFSIWLGHWRRGHGPERQEPLPTPW